MSIKANGGVFGRHPTYDDVTITGGSIDGTQIGATNAAAVTGSVLTSETDVVVADKIVHAGDTNTYVHLQTDDIQLFTNGTSRIRANLNGDVVIGDVSPLNRLHVRSDADSNRGILIHNYFNGASARALLQFGTVGGGWDISVPRSFSPLIFERGGVEAMRHTGAEFLIGTSTAYAANYRQSILIAGSGGTVYRNTVAASTRYPLGFQNSTGAFVGSISINDTSTAYNVSSDYRLKEDVQPMAGALDRLNALKPVNFAWKSTGTRVDGFLAHEAQTVVPEAVTGTKDAVEIIGTITDAEGLVVSENVTQPDQLEDGQVWTQTGERPIYQGIDQSKLVPLLVAALQEALARIELLEAK